MDNLDISSAVEISPTYYLDNFVALINDVHRRYHGILSDEEQGFRHDFLQLPYNAQCLYVRLVSRKGPLFRVDKLSYGEIEDLKGALDSLADGGFIEIDPEVPLGWSLNMLSLEELRSRFPGVPRGLRKAQFIEDVCSRIQSPRADKEADILPPSEVIGEEILLLQVAKAEVLEIYQLLYFGNTYQDLSEFVLAELGVFNYEDYALDGSAKAFRSRQELDALHEAIGFRQAVWEAMEQDPLALEALEKVAPPDHSFPAAQRVWSKALNELARYREREGRHEVALKLYRAANYPPSRERIARILYKDEAYEEALWECEQMLRDPWNEQEETAATRIGERCLKKLKRPVPPRPKAVIQEERVPFEPNALAAVELLGLELLTQDGLAQGYYVENWLFNGVFGLYFWDVIFAPVPDAFYHPFQRGPKDLYAPEFRDKRQALLEDKLEQLMRGDAWHEAILRTWQAKQGRLNPFVHWAVLSQPLIERALQQIPAVHFELIFRRMLKDLRNHCSGFPDLILFGPDEGYELVEIKGPGDRLQDHQRRWLEFFAMNGIPARVVYLDRA